MTRTTRIAPALYMVLVFLSGSLVGVFGHRLYSANSVGASTRRHKSPEEFRQQYISEMSSRLRLSGDQITKLNSILDTTRERFREARKRAEPEMKQIHADQVRQIEEILEPTQREEYGKLRAEREARRKKDFKGGPPPGI